MRRYVQLHSLPSEASEWLRKSRQAPPEFDGVAQLWWDSFEAMPPPGDQAAAEAGRLLLQDERKFIDLARSPLWFGEEAVIF